MMRIYLINLYPMQTVINRDKQLCEALMFTIYYKMFCLHPYHLWAKVNAKIGLTVAQKEKP